LPLSGDDQKFKDIVAKLIDAIGFDPVDVGSIAQSFSQEPGSPLYCTDLSKKEFKFWYPKIKRELLHDKREKLVHLYLTWPKDVTFDEQLKEARTIFQNGLN
jgi:hypothetical protein